jgi:predicted permease
MLTSAPGQGSGTNRFELDGHLIEKPNDRPSARTVTVSGDYFALLDIPIVRGRTFDRADGTPGHEAAIVTRAFAVANWPNEDPIGKRLRFHGDKDADPWMTVVGLSGDLIQSNDTTTNQPIIFTPYRQSNAQYLQIAVRADRDASPLTRAFRAEAQRIDANLALSDVRTLEALLSDQLWPYRVFGTLFFVFALAALLMAAVGLYAVMSQSTIRRTREIGIRMALGATPRQVLGTAMKRGLVQLSVGLVAGLGAAFAATGAMRSLLIGVEPADPTTFASSAGILVAVGLLACWLPARRASAIAPMQALAEQDRR